ncbi:nuclear pore complex protein NUP1-like [Rutidosis leptorrhynchoides]|uniref:nuclear pore complex protein NUP1-like n=1 Tax=Rutidosis leptorrhynchoides TaxID=125765 RepID=UPI003A9A31D1
MATAREQPSSSRGNAYESESGGFGKFRKKTNRRSHQSTPYDRPPTAIRNSLPNNVSRSWFSRIVDPTQRLITSSAHWFFDSVRKRLPAPITPLVEPERDHDARDDVHQPVLHSVSLVLMHHFCLKKSSKAPCHFFLFPCFLNLCCIDYHVINALLLYHPLSFPFPSVESLTGILCYVTMGKKDPSDLHGGPTSGPDRPTTSSHHGELTDLEKILRQKTFTRSEIERLTSLLHSKTVDLPMGNEEKRPELIPIPSDRMEEIPKTAARNNSAGSGFASHPATNMQVLDEDIASPAELAKAYMGTKVSPSMLGLRSQASREDSPVFLSSQPSVSKSPIMALVPRSSGYPATAENGFVTPRSRGRSAIYSMSRTPYARVQSTASVKSARHVADRSDIPSSSSSQSVWEQKILSGSQRGALKRRNSFLENDIGSAGPMRRIRQKSNLLPAKNLCAPDSGFPLPRKIGPSSSVLKPVSLDESKHSLSRSNIENCVYSSGTSFNRVPSQSSEMATRILEQLDKLVSPKEKSPHKLSSSMLRGPPLKSLENIDSAYAMKNAFNDGKKDGVLSNSLSDTRDVILEKSNLDDNGPRNYQDLHGKTISLANGVNTTDINKDILPAARNAESGVVKPVSRDHPQKNAFKMNAQEGRLVLDDDDHSNGVTTAGMEKKAITSEAILTEKPLVPPPVETMPITVLKQKAVHNPAEETATAGKRVSFAFSAEPISSATIHPTSVVTESAPNSDGFISVKEPNAPPDNFANGDKDTVPKEQSSAILSFTPSSKAPDVVPQLAVTSSRPDSSSGFASVSTGATDSIPGATESDKMENKNIPKEALLFRTSESTLPLSGVSPSFTAAGIFSNNSSINNGSISSIPPFSAGQPPVSTDVVNGSFSSSSTAFPSVSGSPLFKFGPSVVPSTPLAFSSASVLTETKPSAPSAFSSATILTETKPSAPLAFSSATVSTETMPKEPTSFGNLMSNPLVGSPFGSAAGSTFWNRSAPAAISDNTSDSTSSAIISSTASIFPFAAKSAPSDTIQNANGVGLGSCTSAPSFGLSSSNPFSSTNLFGFNTAFGLNSSSAPSTVPSPMSSSLQAPKPSPFSSPSPSTGFTFAASSSSHPVFGNNSSPFLFSSSAPTANNNNNQMEDSMAEDTVQGNPTSRMPPPEFGQQPVSTPSPNFIFGSPGTNPAAPFANPFQFGSQQNQNPNPSPLQASSSLDFNAGGTGSFSLGSTGGGDKSTRRVVKVNRGRHRKK